jgi:hypothetical protein
LRIGVIGSMQFTEILMATCDNLRSLGHDAYLTGLHEAFVGKTDDEKERIKIEQKMYQDAIREFWRAMKGGDAVLAMNLDKHGVANYIGANTFLEIGFAHVLDQRIFLWNPAPDNQPYIRTELDAMRPTVIFADLRNIR